MFTCLDTFAVGCIV